MSENKHVDLDMADDFDRAIWAVREEYGDAVDIERELRFAKAWADSVETEEDHEEGPNNIGFHKDGNVFWYLIGDAYWDADDPRSELLLEAIRQRDAIAAERDHLSSALAAAEKERDDQRAENEKLMTLLGEAMKTQEALTKEVATYRENAPLVRLVSMLGLGEPVRPDIYNATLARLKRTEDERDSARNDRDIVIERLRSTIAERDSARAEAEKMRDEVAHKQRVIDQRDKDWHALVVLVARALGTDEDREMAECDEVDEFDPWNALRNHISTALAQDEREGKGE